MLKTRIGLFFIAFSTILFISISDIYTKSLVFSLFSNGSSTYEVLPFLNLSMVYNKGISFGILSGFKFSNLIFIIISSIITILLFVYAILKIQGIQFIGVIVICGGSVGNIYDRIFIGAVRDFIDFHIFAYHWPAFNIADSAISIGAILCIIDFARSK